MVGGLRPRPMVGVERHPMVAAVVAQVDSEAVAMSPLVEAVVIVVEAEGATAVAAVVTAAVDITKRIFIEKSRRLRAAFVFQCPSSPAGARSGVSRVCAVAFCGRSGGG